MGDIESNIVLSYHTVLAPFLLITSCATLVWALQNRYSQVVHSIRVLSQKWHDQPSNHDEILIREQFDMLKDRARLLKNSVVGHYLAMSSFLLTGILLTLAIYTSVSFVIAIVLSFFCGLLIICCTLLNTIRETTKNLQALQRELDR